MASMLDCRAIQPRLSEYVDGALSESDAWEIEKHVATCAVCARVAADFSSTAQLLGALPAAEPSSDFEARLALRLADQALTPRPLTAWDRFKMAWEGHPRMRTALTSGVALAGILPVALFAFQHLNPAAHPPVPMIAEASPLEQIVRDHVAAGSREPLGDSSSLMLASASGSGLE